MRDSKLLPDDADELIYIEEYIKWELRTEMAFLNEDNNSKIISKWNDRTDIKKWMYSYQSTAWIFVRGAWYFDFMSYLFRLIVTNKDASLSTIGHQAYDEALRHHHNWFFRQLAAIGLAAITSR